MGDLGQLRLADPGEHPVDHGQAPVRVALGPVALPAGGHPLPVGLGPPVLGPPPEPGDRHEPDDEDGHQGGRVRVAPAPLAGAADRPHPPGPDRPVVEEPLQVVGQLGRRLVAAGRVLLDRLEDDRLLVAGHGPVDPPRRRRPVVHDLGHESVAVGLVERRAQGEQLVEGQSQGVDVAADVRLPVEPLGGHVPDGADDVAGVRHVVVVGVRLGQPEVGHPHGPAGVQEQVRGLDVAVHHPLAGRVGEGVGDLQPDPGGAPPVLPAGLGQRRPPRLTRQVDAGRGARRAGSPVVRRRGRELPAEHRPRRPGRRPRAVRLVGRGGAAGRPAEAAEFGEDLVEPLAGDELHDVVVHPALLADPVDRDDVGVVQPRRRPRLAAEPSEVPRVGQGVRRQDLQRDVPAERLLLGLVHDAHPAAAHLADDPVVAQTPRPAGDPAGLRAAVVGRVGADPLQGEQCGEQAPDAVGPLRVAVGVLRQRRPLAAAVPPDELLGQFLDRVAVR